MTVPEKHDGPIPGDAPSEPAKSPDRGKVPLREENPPSAESLSILGAEDTRPDDEEAPPWHDPMMPLEERMGLARDKDELSIIYASLGQTDCTSCGYENCRSYARALEGRDESSLDLCIPGGEETEEMLHELLDGKDAGGGAAGGTGPADPPAC